MTRDIDIIMQIKKMVENLLISWNIPQQEAHVYPSKQMEGNIVKWDGLKGMSLFKWDIPKRKVSLFMWDGGSNFLNVNLHYSYAYWAILFCNIQPQIDMLI